MAAPHRPGHGLLLDCRPQIVMPYTQGLRGHASDHEKATRDEIVRRLALLKGCASSAEKPQAEWGAAGGAVYLVPSDTLVVTSQAHALGVHGVSDLFGGVVPHAFMATKAITHPLYSADAAAPPHWSVDFPAQVASAVLPGFTAFSREDARLAATALLALGPVRVKMVCETGGRGQTVVEDLLGFDACLAPVGDDVLAQDGVVLEHHLDQVQTLSVGQVSVAGTVASYFGTQRLTRSNHGAMAYGGSELTVVRGGFDALRSIAPNECVRTAVQQALVYDRAAKTCFDGFFASRLNYDVAQGLDAAGRWCSGVLEQSWRVGGATGAEIAALEVFDAAPDRCAVRTRCIEIFGPCEPPPADAVVYFQGEDSQAGPLTKYTTVSRTF
ncbi:biotin carboxylase [Rhodoferax koreense]|uniref:Biotin carboxylase n=1 Tax=Rhodoferax koreensis TaxID=1842727 RepID=A0A1P8K4H2_9BURK|nr:biotin carboxylase [Rhodoferax koreense]